MTRQGKTHGKTRQDKQGRKQGQEQDTRNKRNKIRPIKKDQKIKKELSSSSFPVSSLISSLFRFCVGWEGTGEGSFNLKYSFPFPFKT
jgi:hypothetical protein